VFKDIHQNFVSWSLRCSPYIGLIKGDQIKCAFGQSVTAVTERLRIEKLAVCSFNPSGFAANIPRGANVAGSVIGAHPHAIARLEFPTWTHGSPHLASNSASLRSISSLVRIFFSIKMVSMLAIHRS